MTGTAEYDFIVVGAGSAGCIVAERLSRRGSAKVLVVEAGPSDRRLWVKLPVGYGRCYRDPAVNWCLQTEPQRDLDGRRSYWPRGKVVGGSGSINALVWMRGLPSDFDAWNRPGWRWDDIAPHFKQIEAALGAGDSFPTDVSADCHPANAAFTAAGRELGEATDVDFNSSNGQRQGFGGYRIATRRGLRRSAADAFLRPALKRGNCRLVTGSEVTRLTMEGSEARGVELSDGRKFTARAAVILSAGAVHSPALLLRSGVEHPAIGANLQDHLAITHYFKATQPTVNEQLHGWLGRARAALRYALTRDGLLAMSINQYGGLVRTGPGAGPADCQLYFTPASYSTAETEAKTINFDPFPGFLLSAQPCRPASRGRVSIDNKGAPVITSNALSTNEDCEAAVTSQRYLQRLLKTEALTDLIDSPLGDDPRAMDDAALLADYRARASTVYHPVGTCALGTVCQDDGSVLGTNRLHVIDASLFPIIPSANTNAPTMAVASKASDLLAERYSL